MYRLIQKNHGQPQELILGRFLLELHVLELLFVEVAAAVLITLEQVVLVVHQLLKMIQ